MAGYTTHFTNSDRSKIYRASKSKIKNSADIYSIPKDKKKRTEREKIIERYLKKIDKKIYCEALHGDVIVLKKGRNETITHASRSYKSTLAALNLEEALKEAKKIKTVPIKRTSKNQKCFKCMHILICAVENVGYAKIMVGEFHEANNIPTPYAHYCITHLSVKQIKK